MKIIAYAASSSTRSINKRLVTYAASLLSNAEVEILDLNDYAVPLFSEDLEREAGHPDKARQFLEKISEADGLIISFAEHNASYSAAYKNLFDWCSRIEPKVYQNKPMVMLSASDSRRGGSRVLGTALKTARGFGGRVTAHLSVPKFSDNFDLQQNRLTNPALRDLLAATVKTILFPPSDGQ